MIPYLYAVNAMDVDLYRVFDCLHCGLKVRVDTIWIRYGYDMDTGCWTRLRRLGDGSRDTDHVGSKELFRL